MLHKAYHFVLVKIEIADIVIHILVVIVVHTGIAACILGLLFLIVHKGTAFLWEIIPQTARIYKKGNGNLYFISQSRLSNTSQEKNSPRVMSRPSQNFFIVVMEISRLFLSIIL